MVMERVQNIVRILRKYRHSSLSNMSKQIVALAALLGLLASVQGFHDISKDETYLEGVFQPTPNITVPPYAFRLYPGWNGKLSGPIVQYFVPNNKVCHFDPQTVTVVPGFNAPKDNNSLWQANANVNIHSQSSSQYGQSSYISVDQVMILFNNGNSSSNSPVNASSYLNGTIIFQENQTQIKGETFKLIPGWSSKLNRTITQYFMPTTANSYLKGQNVTVQPGWANVSSVIKGVRTIVEHVSYYIQGGVEQKYTTLDHVTVWFNNGIPEPVDNSSRMLHKPNKPNNNNNNNNCTQSLSATLHFENGALSGIDSPQNIPFNGSYVFRQNGSANPAYIENVFRFPLAILSRYQNVTLKFEIVAN